MCRMYLLCKINYVSLQCTHAKDRRSGGIAKIAHWCHLPLRSKYERHRRMLAWVFQAGLSEVKVRVRVLVTYGMKVPGLGYRSVKTE